MIDSSDFLARPVRSLQTMLAVLARADDNAPTVIPDGIYGPETTAAVNYFQQKNALPVTAVVDNDTWNRIVDAYFRTAPTVMEAAPFQPIWQPLQTISSGDENLHLYPIQAMLLALSRIYPDLPQPDVTGVHDDATDRAVRWLQRKSGLYEDGILTQREWRYLTALYRLAAYDGT